MMSTDSTIPVFCWKGLEGNQYITPKAVNKKESSTKISINFNSVREWQNQAYKTLTFQGFEKRHIKMNASFSHIPPYRSLDGQ